MNYSNYYEQPDFYGAPPPKKRGGAGAIIVTAVVCLLLGALIASLFLPGYSANPEGMPSNTGNPEPTAEQHAALPGETPVPTPVAEPQKPTPVPTERPLPEFDGQSPTVSGEYSSNPIPDIVEACAPSVVGINIYATNEYFNYLQMVGGGSGFVISSEGYIITNAHVVEDAETVEVIFSDGTTAEATIIGADRTTDIAVIKVERKGLTALKLGDSEKLRVGEFTIAIGDPTGQELAGTTTFGIISALERKVNLDGRTNEYIQTDAAINPGNSGGPLLNMSGEVIGITSAKTVTAGYDEYGNEISAEGLGFAIPISDAIPVVEELITSGRLQRPGIGISIIQPSEIEIQELQIPVGVIVYSVTKDGPGHIAGLQKYDVITECNGVPTVDRDAFVALVQSKTIGETLTFKVWRDGEYIECSAIVGDLNLLGTETVKFELDQRYGW